MGTAQRTGLTTGRIDPADKLGKSRKVGRKPGRRKAGRR